MFQPKRQDNFYGLEKAIKRHEDNIKFLNSQVNHLDESILGLQDAHNAVSKNGAIHAKEETTEQILQQDSSAAGIFCRVKTHHAIQSSNLPLTKDVLGIVASLARVDNDNLSRLLSEYLGLETMLGIVCRTFEGIKALEKYGEGGKINCCTGLHGLGSSIGRKIDGRFLVICLEDLRPYVGGVIANDPQKKLAISKPKLPNGKCPSGFLDYAVNMITMDNCNLFCLTAGGHGLRETLFYSLFSQLQVYSTRAEMLRSLLCITHGALSLDGGMIKKNGVFALGERKDVEVKFSVISSGSDIPANHIQTEDRIRMLKWERLNIAEDIRREKLLLEKTKIQFMRQG